MTATSTQVEVPTLKEVINAWYERVASDDAIVGYHHRHNTESALILTNYDDEHAAMVAGYLSDRTAGKIVVEVGAGIGLLAMHVARDAKRVYAIELDPMWTSCFLASLYQRKPANLTFIFGKAEECPPIAADVAFFCTHSGRQAMYQAATRFAPEVIDVYAELLKDDPNFKKYEAFTW